MENKLKVLMDIFNTGKYAENMDEYKKMINMAGEIEVEVNNLKENLENIEKGDEEEDVVNVIELDVNIMEQMKIEDLVTEYEGYIRKNNRIKKLKEKVVVVYI